MAGSMTPSEVRSTVNSLETSPSKTSASSPIARGSKGGKSESKKSSKKKSY